jgi:hypothetical protein
VRRRGALAALLVLVAALGGGLALLLSGGGEQPPSQPPRPTPSAPPPPSPGTTVPGGPSLAIGLTETNAALIWSKDSGVDVGAFAPWRDRLAALRPRYLRVLVDWYHLQPQPTTPPFDVVVDGCARGLPPCRPMGGLREMLRAIRSQQRAGGGFEVVIDIYGVPPWAARPASGCEMKHTSPRSRPITATGLKAYRALVRGLVALGREEGVPLRWWSAWNEPNGPFFVSPQRAECDPVALSLSPAVYTTFWRAMRDELRNAGGDRRMLLGELADGPPGRRLSTRAGEFLAALPDDVVCGSSVMSQHAYTRRGPEADRPDVVREVEGVLARRPCTRDMPIWLTEVGAGGPVPAEARTDGAAGARLDCRLLNDDLRRWWADPRVTVAFQYTFRDDPAFPVGLVDAGLTHAWPTLDLLEAWGGNRAPEAEPPPLPGRCDG